MKSKQATTILKRIKKIEEQISKKITLKNHILNTAHAELVQHYGTDEIGETKEELKNIIVNEALK